MATTKNNKTTITTDEEVKKTSSVDFEEIQKFMIEMTAKFEKSEKEKEDLQKELNDLKDQNNIISQSKINGSDIKREYIKIVHLIQVADGLSTHISLSNTTRNLKRIGDIMNVTLSEFEELSGKYYKFFEEGILAVDSSCIDIATDYNLPVYDKELQKKYNSKILSNIGDMSKEKLVEFFDSLSFPAQNQFLSYWMNKCYNKDKKYYDREKLLLLNKISNSDVFSSLIFEMNNNDTKKRQTTIEVQ